ncbi:MAG: hypothetical protein ACPGNV_14190 [Mangrovicoccus sp.]
MMATPQVKLIDTQELELYPISASDRLDSHYFLQWNLKRWRGSEFRKTCDPEVGWYGFQLFCIAQDGSPIGTLPCDDKQLAFDLNLPLEKWQALIRRDVTPLHGWYQVQCDNGELRYAHPVVTEVAVEALASKRRNASKNADERMRKRLGTIAQNLKVNIPGGARIAQNEELINRISDWIENAYPGGSATVKRIQEAWEALSQQL